MPLEPKEPSADSTVSTRVEILKSAAVAFRRLGYHGATVEQIAATLEMQKGNLYYYFRNKEEILFACHQYSLDQLLPLLQEVDGSETAPSDKLRRLVRASIHTILDDLHGMALFVDLEALSPDHRHQVIERRDQFDRGIRQVIREGIQSGVFRDVDAKLVSFAILGAVNWIPRWFSPEGPRSSQDVAEHFADFLLAGLRRV